MGGRWSIIGGARELGLGIVKLLHFPSFFPSSEEPVQNTQNSFIDDTRPQGKVPGFLSELSGTLKLSFPNWVLFESFADAEMAARDKEQRLQQSLSNKAAEQRRLVVQASEPVRLLSTSPEFELPAHEANTVLEIRAEQMH